MSKTRSLDQLFEKNVYTLEGTVSIQSYHLLVSSVYLWFQLANPYDSDILLQDFGIISPSIGKPHMTPASFFKICMTPTTEAYEVSETGLTTALDQFTGADGNGPYYHIGPDYAGRA